MVPLDTLRNGPPDAVLFDLGGVLVDFGGLDQFRRWLPPGADEADLWRRWLHSPSVRRFESGEGDASAFARGVIGEFGLPLTPERFLQLFVEWIHGPMPGAWELLDALRPRVELAYLSNTSELHWPKLSGEMSIPARFHFGYASFRIGAVKPDERAFRHALDSMGREPGDVLFLDDNRINVEAARALGLRAEVARGVEGARDALRLHGLEV
jgi:putative hydrolase of the HAD superfamily